MAHLACFCDEAMRAGSIMLGTAAGTVAVGGEVLAATVDDGCRGGMFCADEGEGCEGSWEGAGAKVGGGVDTLGGVESFAGGRTACGACWAFCVGELDGKGAVKLDGGLGNSDMDEGGWTAMSSREVCCGSEVGWGLVVVDSSACCPPGGPGAGTRPSRRAFIISVAFHFAYFIFAST